MLSFAVIATLIAPSYAFALKALASTLPVYIFAKNVAGDKAEVSLLVPPGTDVHEYSLRPSDIKRMAEADIVLLSGAGLDDHIRKRAGARAVDTSKGASLIPGDPHIWLDPDLALVQVKNICDALIEKDPANRDYYSRNADGYIERLASLDREIAQALQPFRGKYLITYHEAFGYIGRRYGLKTYSLTGPGAESPLPGRMKKVYDIVRQEGVKAIFVERQFPAEAGGKLARELKTKICELDSLESGRPEAGYYEDAMRRNMESIVKCLGEGG